MNNFDPLQQSQYNAYRLIANAYAAINSIQFDSMYFRRDIGFRANIT